MAKVMIDENFKKQILDQTSYCGKRNRPSAKKGERTEFLTVYR
jgi:hypothetical protein